MKARGPIAQQIAGRAWTVLILLCIAQQCVQAQGLPGLPDPRAYFRITVVDEETNRGIPLVKLTTVTNVVHYTDSAGVIAFYDPALMNRKVFFYVESHGYEYPKDGFGLRGKTLDVAPGGSAALKMKRINVAQRLYRITGSGIYQDSILLGDRVPIRHPISNAGVMGQDSAIVTFYHGRLFWIWGDTKNARYPIAANFKVTAATSELPGQGGLDPERGVDLEYFAEGDFVKSMAPLPGTFMYWLGSLFVARDPSGKEHLLAHYAKVKPPMETVGRGMVAFNDEKQVFEKIREDAEDELIPSNGMPFRMAENGKTYLYFFSYVLSRAPDEYESLINRDAYEAFTCLKEGSHFDGAKEQLDRTQDGALRYAWRKNTSPVGPKELTQLEKNQLIQSEERWIRLTDVKSGKNVELARGAIAHNPYRKRWIMIACEKFGTSSLGEIWYAEADAPTGPWTYATKVVTHDQYSFYNPLKHPHFAKDNGRVIFFEGTYTKTFSGNKTATPRYDYNQIMYKLELDDPRLFLPVPIYRTDEGFPHYRPGAQMPAKVTKRVIAFYAPDRPSKGTEPLHVVLDDKTGGPILCLGDTDLPSKQAPVVVCYALPADSTSGAELTVPLYEYRHQKTGMRFYSVEVRRGDADYERMEKPICRVWPCPTAYHPFP